MALLAAVRDGRLVSRASFFQTHLVRKARAAGVPMQLVAHEDVIILAADGGPATLVRTAGVSAERRVA